MHNTVNSENFVGVLFSQNSQMRCFVKIKHSQNGQITLSLIDVGKLCLSLKFLMCQLCLLALFARNKFFSKISKFTVIQTLNRRLTTLSTKWIEFWKKVHTESNLYYTLHRVKTFFFKKKKMRRVGRHICLGKWLDFGDLDLIFKVARVL